jgi:hypothetical protein
LVLLRNCSGGRPATTSTGIVKQLLQFGGEYHLGKSRGLLRPEGSGGGKSPTASRARQWDGEIKFLFRYGRIFLWIGCG